MGDGDYMYAFQQVVMPIAQEFDPDFVIGTSCHCGFQRSANPTFQVAAGFDAAAGDELGGCFVSPACYAHMTHMLMTLAGGRVAVCLEVRGSSLCSWAYLNKIFSARVDITSDRFPNLLWL